jgi:glycosyltransferase involved in cell wall biosynthesis
MLNGIEHLANHTLGRAVLRSATHIVFCSTNAAEEFAGLLTHGGGPKSSIIPNGIDTDRFRPPTLLEREAAREDLKLPPLARVALFVGRLVEKKGVNVLVELVKQLPSHLFLIVGDGPLRTKIPANSKNVVWLAELAPERMAVVYKAADVFVLPSHGEGLPLSVQEAMACGLPVIVSQDEQFTSTLQSEEACIATERTAEAFHRSLNTLADDHHLSTRLRARARELAVREWSLGVMTARYEHLINELTGKAE